MSKTATAAEMSAGHNRPPMITPKDLERDFAYVDEALAALEREVEACPLVVEDDDDLEIIRKAVRHTQGVDKRLESLRIEVKEPFLGGCRVVDAHFSGRREKVGKWQSGVEARAKRYLDKKAAEEKAAREAAARKAAEEARIAAEAARKAEEDRIAAEQARLAAVIGENREAHEETAREEVARQEEARTRAAAMQTNNMALQAQAQTDVKPADLARTRTGDGLSTLEEHWFAEILEPHDIDLNDNVLRSFIPTSEIEKALGRYAKLHHDSRPLRGVRFFSDTKVRMT